jgi:hypothetical protein
VISGCGGGGVADLRSEHGWTLECGAAQLVVPWWTGGRGAAWWREGGREGGDLGFRGNDVGAFYTCDIGRVSGEGALAWALLDRSTPGGGSAVDQVCAWR